MLHSSLKFGKLTPIIKRIVRFARTKQL